MSNKFKIGDRVRVIAECGNEVPIGYEGVVKENSFMPWIHFDNEMDDGTASRLCCGDDAITRFDSVVNEIHLELVTEAPSKPQPDKVTYTTVTTITSSDGHTFTETEIDGKSVEELKQYRSLLARHERLFKKAS